MRRSAFTLAELLAVISITAVLMAVLIPALQHSRQQAKAVICNSNIKQLISGLFMYGIENHTLPYSFYNSLNKLPPPGGYPGHSYDRMGWWWFNFIDGYYKKSEENSTTLKCPSKWLTDYRLNNNILCGNYGVNRSVCKSSDDRQNHREEFVGTPLRIMDILQPSETMLIVDSGYTLINWWHATDSPPVALGDKIEDTAYIPGLQINKERILRPGQEKDAINGRHPNKTVNIGFADGHISRIKADDLFIEKMDNGYKNKTPLWTPK